jgi:uncharacterized phiE125 gp8 family phage protein
MARYPSGQPIRLSFTVRDITGALVNPTAATLVVKIAAADGTSTTTGTYASLSNDGVGLLHQDIPVTDLVAAGHYQYALTTTGTGAGVSFGEFDVFDPFETSVLPLADAKDHLNIPQATTTSDAEIAGFVATIESALERWTGGPLVSRQVTERAEMLSDQTVILVRQRPLVSVVSITSASGGTIDISGGLDIDVNAGTVRRKLGLPFYGPFFTWMPVVTVTYVAGWGTAVPAAFASAARIILAHLWESQRGPASLPGLGGADLVTPPGMGFAIPAMAAELLDGSANGMPFRSEAFV